MIRIGKLTDYALLILGHMAQHPNHVISAASLADTLHLSVPTVSKILKILSEGALVTSTRGADGGYRLAKLASELTVAEVIATMEGDLALTECCESINTCMINTRCAMRDNWSRINHMIHTLLSRFTILDMLKPIEMGLPEGWLYDKQAN
jgi:FeS assembly SUF system regulator